MQLQRPGLCSRQLKPTFNPCACSTSRPVRCSASRKQSSSAAETADTAASTSGAGVETPSTPVTREFNALGSKVVESNIAFKGPEDEKDFWEGEQFDAFGKALENYFVPGLIALGIVCGGIAAKSYNDGATAFVKPAPGPDAEASIIIAIPDAGESAPSPSS